MRNYQIIIAILIVATLVFAYYKFSDNLPVEPYRYSYQNSSADDIVVSSTISTGNKIQIQGKARGYWYFEASFPVEIKDTSGNTIGNGIAEAQAEWMTEEFVPFNTEINLAAPYSGEAIITLKKDNPSGDSQKDAALTYPTTL